MNSIFVDLQIPIKARCTYQLSHSCHSLGNLIPIRSFIRNIHFVVRFSCKIDLRIHIIIVTLSPANHRGRNAQIACNGRPTMPREVIGQMSFYTAQFGNGFQLLVASRITRHREYFVVFCHAFLLLYDTSGYI